MKRILTTADGRKLASVSTDPFDVELLDAGEESDIDVYDLVAGIDDATSIEADTAGNVPDEQSPPEELVEARPEYKQRLLRAAIDDADQELAFLTEDEASGVENV